MVADRIYLDNAATSWPKPEVVYQAVDRYQREIGAAAGRSAYQEAAEAQRIVDDARSRLARLIGATNASRIVFTFNGTDGLNLALHGVLRSGDHVVTTVVEHNSVLRPLRMLQEQGVEVSYVACDSSGLIQAADIESVLRAETRLIAVTHASNVTGAIQPVQQIGRVAQERNILLLVDAAQTAGHLPLDVNQLGAHLLAASGHKGLLGPLGTGFLYIAPGVEHSLRPLRQGGTGTQSEEDRQPAALPERYECGNLNVAGLAGLAAALAWIEQKGPAALRSHEQALLSELLEGLQSISGVTVYGPRDPEHQVGVVSLNVAGYDPQELAALLDSAYAIQARSGLHCAPRMHQQLQTSGVGGTVRLSVGPLTTAEQIQQTLLAVEQIASSAVQA